MSLGLVLLQVFSSAIRYLVFGGKAIGKSVSNLLHHLLKVLFQGPPIFKFERFVSSKMVGLENYKD